MYFHTLQFVVFFPVVTILYFVVPHRRRWLVLLAAGCYFYMAFVPLLILLPLSMITVNYFMGMYIERSAGRSRKWFLTTGIVANVLVLMFFRYFHFIDENLLRLAQVIHWNYPLHVLGIVVPLGISFQTFQSIAYLIEVHRGNVRAERHYGYLAVYVLFYPLQACGPIERPQNLLRQLHERQEFDYRRVADGLKLMAWGFFKKLVIADRLAQLVNPVYDHPASYQGPLLLLSTIGFAYQIYCDFSGYTDIARGAAQVMGFKLLENFHNPYHAGSISDFWRRWHISLSTWLRDYLFLPVTYTAMRKFDSLKSVRLRQDFLSYAAGILVTMFICGLWHGSNYTYIVWGMLMGFYMIASVLTRKFRRRSVRLLKLQKVPLVHNSMRITMTFLLVCLAWVFFRANTVHDAVYIISHLLSGFRHANAALLFEQLRVTLGANLQVKILFSHLSGVAVLIIVVLEILVLEVVQILQDRGSVREMLNRKPFLFRLCAYYAVIMMITLLGVFEQSGFIYFKF